MDRYLIERTFYDLTDTVGLSAQQTKTYDASGRGSDNNNYMTPNTVTSSSTGGRYYREITSLEIIPPQDANGNYEDLREIRLVVDGKDTGHYILVSGNGNQLTNPPRQLVWGGPHLHIKLGEPLWRVVQDKRANPNMAVRAIAPKYRNNVSLAVYSRYGVTGAGSGGFRIVLKGYQYTADELTQLAAGWKGQVYAQTLRRVIQGQPPVNFTFTLPGPFGPDTFTALPGGADQRETKINPYWHFATPAEATSPSRAFVLSNLNALGGGTGHVEDTFQDLGFEGATNTNALIVRGWGVKGIPLPPGQTGAPGVPGQNLAFAGWFVNGDFVPEIIGNNGIPMTQGVEPLAFGAAEPFIAVPNVFVPIPRFPGELLLYKDNAAPFITDNGSSIPANQVAVAIQGVLIENVPA